MKKHTTNRFYKGINTDLSFLERDAQMLLDGLNFRIANKSVDGLFAVTLKGNREEFALTDGFLPIGAAEYNGILFILSANETTGEGEIGTFPTPNGTSQGFTRIYTPLQNYTLDNPNVFVAPCDGAQPIINRANFKTTSLKFDCHHQARVLARLDFDKSVNLYWTDNFNPLRSINTGFHSETGIYNDRYVSENMIQSGIINIISESEFIPIVKLDSVEENGRLKGGHYFFFVRYVDRYFNTSSFLGMSSAVPIFHRQEVLSGNDIAYGLEEQTIANMNAILDISELDTAAGFIEIGYIYYYGKDLFEIKLIDVRHAINGSSTLTINIIGNEPTIDLSLDEFISYKPTDALYVKDITQLNNKLYVANTRGIILDHEDLRKFCCSIKIGEDSSLERDVEHLSPSSGTNLHIYGIDPLDVHSKVGYFSGETYIFSVVPIFKGGFAGLAFPMTGYDNYTGTPADENHQGVYRFSAAGVTPFYQANKAYIKGVTFDTSAAATIYNNSQFLKDNLIGLYFCRGERVPNLLYQGLMVFNHSVGNGPYGVSRDQWQAGRLNGAETLSQNFALNIFMPLIEQAIPCWAQYYVAGVPEAANAQMFYKTPADSFYAGIISSTRAIFSLDYLLDIGASKEGVGSKSTIEIIGKIDYADWSLRAPGNDPAAAAGIISAQPFELFIQNDLTYFSPSTLMNSSTHNKHGFDAIQTIIKNEYFVSKISEGIGTGALSGQTASGAVYIKADRDLTDNDEHFISLPIAVPAHILAERGPITNPITSEQERNSIVNVHVSDPTTLDYITLYDFKNTLFSPISDFIKIEDLSDVTDITDNIYYNGDCFVARNYIKIMHGFNDEMGDGLLSIIALTGGLNPPPSPTIPYLPEYGILLGIVTENKYNPNYRYSKGRNGFYPKDSTDFIKRMNAPEAHFYNTGYQRMLNPRQFLGIDVLKPVSDNSFPTRIRPSLKHILNSLRDGYLQFVAGEFKDFDFQYGPINALISTGEQLYSIQNDAINLHPIDERAITPSDGTDTPFVLGESRELTEYRRLISNEYGSQHQWSVIQGERGIYGFDWNKRVYWRVGGNGFENLGLLKGCEKWIEDVVNLHSSGVSDITEQLPDNPVCNLGIHSVYDRENKEVIVTFIFGENKNRTIPYSEKAEHFEPKFGFTPTFYAELERDLYSFKDGKFWLHNSNPLNNNFYGQQQPAFIEVVVNPEGEITKHFDNLIISSNNREFSKISYETQHQFAIQDPFLGEFWNRAIYREEQWKLPIRRADTIKDAQLSLALVASRMRGRYLIINLEYVGSQETWIRELITAYTESKA